MHSHAPIHAHIHTEKESLFYVLNSYSELKIGLRAAVQAEKHRSALPTGPIQALSQDTSSRSTSHDREGTVARAG